MSTLSQYGWNEFHSNSYNNYQKDGLSLGRVISVKGFRYELISEQGEMQAEVSSKVLYGSTPEGIPKVGDWVLYVESDQLGYITDVLPRMNALERREAGTEASAQVLAANIDAALIVQGLDRDYNLMRLDRYIAQVTVCGIRPVVILNKSDLVEDIHQYITEVHALKRDCAVHACSTLSSAGMEALVNAVLQPGKTYVLIGSSGAGKSSIVNALMEGSVQRTGEVSDFNLKGKHTTTTRELFRLDNGSLLIDTPGMREFGMTSVSDNPAELFPAIFAFASGCKFNDCTHLGEKGCAVVQAVDSGELDELIYRSYVKLIKEQRRFEMTANDKKREGKKMGRMVREAKDYKRRFKEGG